MNRFIFFIMLLPPVLRAAELPPVNLPQTLEQARQHLASREVDSATCVQLASALRAGAEHFPESSIAPDALQAAWKLAAFGANHVLAVQCAEQLLKQAATSPYADEAFDLVWNYLTGAGENPEIGAEFARQCAENSGPDPRAARYYVCAFQGFTSAGRWKDAELMGEKFLQSAQTPAADPTVYLTMADVALTAGNSKMSRTATESFIKLYPKLSHQVVAQLQMGRLHEANGNRSAANESYSSAWNQYDKNKSKPSYADPAIQHAAAEALWTLQRDARATFDNAVASQTSDYAFLNREAQRLLLNYERCVQTSSAYGTQAFTEMGQVAAMLGALHAQRGLERAKRAELDENLRALLDPAIAQNQRAIAYLHNAQVLASTTFCDNPDEARKLRAAAVFTSERCYELTNEQGHWLYAIAQLATDRITRNTGLNTSITERRELWSTDVLPVCLEAFERKCDAVRTAAVTNLIVSPNAEPADRALRNSVAAMVTACSDYWSRTSSSSIQIASSIQIGFRNSGSSEMFANQRAQFDEAVLLAGTILPELTRTYEAVRARSDAGIELQLWEELISRAYGDFSSLCATVQQQINPLVEKLSDDYSTRDGTLRKDLANLAAQATQEEYRTLVTWHKVAAEQHLASAKSKSLMDRLAAIDPQKYGAAPTDASASRKGP